MTLHRTPRRSRTALVRASVGALALGVLAAPTLLPSAGSAATTNPMYRKVSAPNVFYPLHGSSRVKDQATYRVGRHLATEITAPCGAGVYSSQPGTAIVRSSSAWGGKYLVKVVSNDGGLVTRYAYLQKSLVQDGQIIAPGQGLGTVASYPSNGRCQLQFSVTQSGRPQNPTAWLQARVGQAPPVGNLFDARGITIASYNFLGASHTVNSSKFHSYPWRIQKDVALFAQRGLDVIGAQEFQTVQRDYFRKLTGSTYSSFNFVGPRGREDTDNSIIWKNSTMQFVSASTYDIPYFGGNTRHVPVVLLQQKSTGRTAYFMNVHNPADVHGPAGKWRAEAIKIERAKIIELRQTGRPVILTGDFNDRQAAFCPLTAGKLTISPNSVPSMTCAYPSVSSIDWIFAAGQARFSYFDRDKITQTLRYSDHPIVITKAHLQD